MKFQCTQIIFILAQNLFFAGTLVESVLKLESFYLPTTGKSLPKRDLVPFIRTSSENGSQNSGTKNIKNKQSFYSEYDAATKVSTSEIKIYFPGSEYHMKKHILKRSVMPHTQNTGKNLEVNQFVSRVLTSYTMNSVNNFTLSSSNISFENNTDANSNKNNSNYSVPINAKSSANAETENFQEGVQNSSEANKNFRWIIIDFTNLSSTNPSSFKPSIIQIEGNSSDNFSVNAQGNISYIDLCHELYYENRCMLSNVVLDLQNLFRALNTDETDLSIPEFVSEDVGKFSDPALQSLAQNFNCVIENNDDLNISCTNVFNFYSISEYLPNDTVILDLSYSKQAKLLQPLFPHLKSLKSLKLSNNHHRYITRAFMGLESLEILDLSNNDIMVLLKVFSYIPRLKMLDLSGNLIKTVKIVSDAVSYLDNLQNLILNHNYRINQLTKEDLYGLKNFNLTVFSLYNSTIRYIERGAFSFLPNLKVLEISINYMNEYALANITCSITESIEIVFFRLLVNIQSFPYDAVYCLRNAKVRELYLGNNNIKSIPVLPNLPNLQVFSMSNCSLEIIEENAFGNVTNIEVIDFSSNRLVHFPIALTSVKSLKKLYINTQYSELAYELFTIYDYSFQHLTHLDTLRLSLLRINKLSRYLLYGLRNLQAAFLSLAELFIIEDFAFETLTSLRILDLRGNGISTLKNFTFWGLINLKHLYLSSNKIKFFPSVYPFQHSPLINVILLQVNEIRTIPTGTFSNLEQLQILQIGRNKLIPWQERIFHPNASLNMLLLSENNIDYISDVMLSEFHQVTGTLDLNKNPFNCSKCGMREFQTFFQNSNLSFHFLLPETKDSIYACVNPESMHNKLFFDVELPEYSCQDIETEVFSLMAIILMSLCLIVTVLLSSLCYTFRWYVRYWIFHFKTSVIDKKCSVRGKTYTFDAFIIYSSIDTPWVEEHLLPALEEQEQRYKLCVHQRDFQVGRQITENILEAIENSHKVILILTEGFIKSEWCMYELHLAQHKLFDDTRDILILIKIRAIDKKLYSKNVSYIEKTRKCYMWTDNQIGQKLFWEQIRKQLGPPRTRQNIQTIAL